MYDGRLCKIINGNELKCIKYRLTLWNNTYSRQDIIDIKTGKRAVIQQPMTGSGASGGDHFSKCYYWINMVHS